MKVRREVAPFVGATTAAGACVVFLLDAPATGIVIAMLGAAFLLFFFRDPERRPPVDSSAILSGADGRVMSVTRLMEDEHLNAECIRITVFLSVFDVHVNRAPISGRSRFIGHFPGKKLFAFLEKASEVNQHNKILIEGPQARCLVMQIVGPVARRVVYWPSHSEATPVKAGDRIGMMKFGSRMDVYLPAEGVEVLAKSGDRVRAGESVIARVMPAGSMESEGLPVTTKRAEP